MNIDEFSKRRPEEISGVWEIVDEKVRELQKAKHIFKIILNTIELNDDEVKVNPYSEYDPTEIENMIKEFLNENTNP